MINYMENFRLILTNCSDPWHNLAMEEHLFDTHAGGVLLFLWQNERTVVVGRNQNAWKECRLALLEEEGGRLARRSSGGGAVFHDLGNLNFSFIAEKGLYDERRQLQTVLDAVAALGVEAGFTGRNDLTGPGGSKFSGSAYRHGPHASLHHGTLLLRADMDKLARYLAPSPEKLKAKGVQSVRARVCNLAEFRSDIDVPLMRESLLRAFQSNYGPYETVAEESLDAKALETLRLRHASWEWRLGATPRFDARFTTRFAWGDFDLQLSLRGGKVEAAQVFSDAMDEAFIRRLAPAFKGLPFAYGDFYAALSAMENPMAEDIADFLRGRF